MRARSLLGILGSVVFVVACAQSDAGITTNVKAKLIADDLVKARELNVDTKNRVVTLTGTVRSAEEETRALQIARNTKGVSDVVDQVTVVLPGEPGTAPTSGRLGEPGVPEPGLVTDISITGAVKAKLLADPGVGGLRIDVDTRDRVVTLTGTVNSAGEKALAVELAGKVDNVARVEDRLTVKPRTP
jgi:hyperosmotically inducible protein